MGWADRHVLCLQAGEVVQFRPRGNSMSPRIESGQLVTIEPLGDKPLEVGEIVLCEVGGQQYVHLIKAVQPKKALIGNNRGFVNGWASARKIYGRVTRVED